MLEILLITYWPERRAAQYNPLDHSVVQAFLKADKWQRFEASDFVGALICALKYELDRVYWNWNQERLDDRKDWQFTDVPGGFEYRRYFVDDCDCGKESPLHAKDCRQMLEHDDEKQDPWPPCTCGATASWVERDYHLPVCSPQLPNMKFGQVIINWYKYIGRGMSTNVDWDEKQWREWFDDAIKAIRLYNYCGQVGHARLRDEDAGRKPFSTHDRVQAKDCKYCVQFGANALIFDRQGSTHRRDDDE